MDPPPPLTCHNPMYACSINCGVKCKIYHHENKLYKMAGGCDERRKLVKNTSIHMSNTCMTVQEGEFLKMLLLISLSGWYTWESSPLLIPCPPCLHQPPLLCLPPLFPASTSAAQKTSLWVWPSASIFTPFLMSLLPSLCSFKDASYYMGPLRLSGIVSTLRSLI